MTADADDMNALRSALCDLDARRARGDLTQRAFESALAERTVALYRARARAAIGAGEPIVAEHHVVRGHIRLNASILREPEQEATSFFATDRRVVRLRSTLVPGRAITADERDGTRVDEVPVAAIRGLTTRREVRWGEAAVGASSVAVALLLHDVLLVTAPLLALLGLLGILHALALPTRWVEVDVATADGDPLRIEAVRKRSARALLRHLRERMG
jgi:hypothetical protein